MLILWYSIMPLFLSYSYMILQTDRLDQDKQTCGFGVGGRVMVVARLGGGRVFC